VEAKTPQNRQPNLFKKNFVQPNNEPLVVLIDIPLEKLAIAMLTLANCCQLLLQSRLEGVQSSSDLQKTEALLSFALLETVSRTMSSHVPLKTLDYIWKALPKISVSKIEAQLVRELLRNVELIVTDDYTEV